MLLAKLRKALKQAADPMKAPAMQAYMKSAMPYHGVQNATRVAVCNAVFANVEFETAAEWEAQVMAIKPSGVDYEQLQPEDIVVLSLAFRVRSRLVSLVVMLVGVIWAFGLLGYSGFQLSLVTIAGLPGASVPNSNPPISEPRELSERKVSTASDSNRSISVSGSRTTTGFCTTSQV